MRVLRVAVGMIVLLLALPVLAAGAVGWWAMQHRSADGAFHAELAPIAAGSRIVVVPDVDAILRRDAPIARAEQTELRLDAGDDAFIGMATPADLSGYLTGVDFTELLGTQLGRGPLAVQSREIVSAGEPLPSFQEQHFWVRGGAGELRWSPVDDRGRQVALIIIAPPGDGPIELSVAVTTGWLNSTTWGLLILGPILLMLGLAALAWPQRPREIVYVVDGATAARAGLATPGQPWLSLDPRFLDQPRLPGLGSIPMPGWQPKVPMPGWQPEVPMPRQSAPAPLTDCGLAILAPAAVPPEGGAMPAVPPDGAMPAVPPDGAISAVPPDGAISAVPPDGAMPGDGRPVVPAQQQPVAWPPGEASAHTDAPREIPTQELPKVLADLPMPTAGMALHLTRNK